ncbi:uncharacterized protein PITG_16178 [Phytophthora infestans T30-4]|uniref:Uncharacterized protein n=1 Tax=Phytophthora infestans (strain T30-4) TaxID=403677 RepID=D0NTB2_PHYIT|nr:uncharacterized protein PITG_16178 [Phytophthora infestans T30-4]EEY64863.1 conserved hypothetical protein [Phytophthora infestans T30-4]|eukprot:XP_002897593.1 conserved hypothetical protein [Phytophthora infestans T30-4]
MLSRLEDVEQQLWTAATAIKLHLRLLKGEHEAIGWAEIAALALVCGRIEQVQSELRDSTTEILSLARISLAGGGSREGEGHEAERDSEDGDTETEDEAEEMEDIKVATEREDDVDKRARGLYTDDNDVEMKAEHPEADAKTPPSQQVAKKLVEVETTRAVVTLSAGRDREVAARMAKLKVCKRNLISLAQKEKLSASVNNEVVPSAGASNSNKRPRTDSDETGPEFKRPRPRDPFDPVKLIVARFGEVALKVKMLVSSGNEVTNRAQEMGSAVGEMKVAATAAINGVTELLEHPDYHGQDIVTQQRWNGHHDEFSVAYSCAESQVCVVAAHHIRVDLQSLATSFTKVEAYTEDNIYEFEREPVPTLDVMESRVKRFRQLKKKNMMSPIQSISGGLLIDISYFSAQNVDKKVVRSVENWSRFTAVGKALAAWMHRALKSKARLPHNFFKRLSEQLQEFDAKFPDKLSPYLLRHVAFSSIADTSWNL